MKSHYINIYQLYLIKSMYINPMKYIEHLHIVFALPVGGRFCQALGTGGDPGGLLRSDDG